MAEEMAEEQDQGQGRKQGEKQGNTSELEISIFSLPRIGEVESSNQDRCDRSPCGHRIALADGAGSSLYPRHWAELLVTHFCEGPHNPIEALATDYAAWLQPIQERWRQYYLTQVQAPQRQWWQAGSASKDHGSAAFLGLCLDVGAEGFGYRAIALGDSCLFHWNPQQQSLQSFPIQTAAAFKSTTQCLESLPEYNHFPPQVQQGCYQKEDVFWLASDALAQWILTEVGNGSIEWEVILNISDREAFRRLIHRLRQEKRIKNDDTTLAVIRSSS